MNPPAAAPLLPPSPVNLPVEVSLLVLGFLDRQTLGRIMVANRRLGGVVNRHRKTLSLPEIPVPPRLSACLKLLAFLAAATVLLLPFGISCAGFSTQSRLKAAGRVPETFHNFKRTDVSVPCTTTCDAQQCHEECTFQYTLLDERKGRITGRNCTSTGMPTTNASLSATVGWNCSFDYAVNEAPVGTIASEVTFRWHWGAWASLFLAVLELPAALLVLRTSRRIADEYMAAARGRRRDEILKWHEELRKLVLLAIIIIFLYAGVCGCVALYGTTLQSFSAVYALFLHLLGVSIELGILCLVGIIAVFFCFAFSPQPYG